MDRIFSMKIIPTFTHPPQPPKGNSYRQYFKGPDGDLEVYLEALKQLPKPN